MMMPPEVLPKPVDAVDDAGAGQQAAALYRRLWVHETFRVFYDRLVDNTDREWLMEQVRLSCVALSCSEGNANATNSRVLSPCVPCWNPMRWGWSRHQPMQSYSLAWFIPRLRRSRARWPHTCTPSSTR